MSADRQQLIAQQRFLEHQQELAKLDLSKRFDYIFQNNLWGSDESRSGPGSTMIETRTLREDIVALLRGVDATSMLDIPCGDFHWLSQVDLGVTYTGADIVPAIVESNQQKYTTPNRQFLRLDATTSPLPQVDLIFCRDCLVHLSFADIRKALARIQAGRITYLMTTTFPTEPANVDIATGDWRPLNFERAPFGFPPPIEAVLEACTEHDGIFADKSMGLWRVANLPAIAAP